MNFPGASAALKAFREAKKGDVVSESEVLRRMSICNTPCPMKKRKSSATTAVSKILGRIANKNRVPSEIADYRCDACGCSFMLMLPSKTLHPDTPEQEEKRPDYCWVRSS